MIMPYQPDPVHIAEQFRLLSLQQQAKIEKLRKQASKLKVQVNDRDKQLAKHKNLYKEMRAIREKHRESEKELRKQD